ncbi:hypothetical protein [Candidatus Oleimmundimicrobium sp.]|uniref:hypothetical protein n=1 Tax=Candidatus Oleimmundimicrobium sp. TaxID=3060597 RepID=UPI0027251007|nr:hypothetical protein [Candidatus Oleimmundimicrobium sp.]MDO8886445.1 hypothetical protein [Candidatus Oleimmundimicrobium sp.]
MDKNKNGQDELFKELNKFCNQLDEKALSGFVASMQDFIDEKNKYASLTIAKKNGRVTGFDLKITYR